MDELKRFYEKIGSEAEPVIERLGGSPDITKRFILRFAEDKSFLSLTEELKNDRTEEAFRSAHTLKGICINLGFDELFREASLVTELLSNGELKEAKDAFPKLEKAYIKVTDAVSRCF